MSRQRSTEGVVSGVRNQLDDSGRSKDTARRRRSWCSGLVTRRQRLICQAAARVRAGKSAHPPSGCRRRPRRLGGAGSRRVMLGRVPSPASTPAGPGRHASLASMASRRDPAGQGISGPALQLAGRRREQIREVDKNGGRKREGRHAELVSPDSSGRRAAGFKFYPQFCDSVLRDVSA